MDNDEFWGLIETSLEHSADCDERTSYLRDQLATLSVEEIAHFDILLSAACAALDSAELVEVAQQIYRGVVGDDLFNDFKLWIIGSGRDTFARVLGDPAQVTTLPGVEAQDDPDPSWEELGYVASYAFLRRHGVDHEADDDRRGNLDAEFEALVNNLQNEVGRQFVN
ncbi:DUF4240 domain-containing protein [Nocardia veterana]|uniref:DUF4240 domain-containing protein n=1 Tax=Nocardia veterana TaxID=132249 RepID=A0A7X6LV19_9NOCA|nr:DUF4240 domain-containing protein [Nocardia veterana]NKY84445.1 DUF4240 domain-containing protein [Nocardia veterana]